MRTLSELNEHFKIVLEEFALLRGNSLGCCHGLPVSEQSLVRESFDQVVFAIAKAQGCLNAALAGRSGLASASASPANSRQPLQPHGRGNKPVPAMQQSPASGIESPSRLRSSRKASKTADRGHHKKGGGK